MADFDHFLSDDTYLSSQTSASYKGHEVQQKSRRVYKIKGIKKSFANSVQS